MKNTLHIFGCSFSEIPEPDTYEDYFKYRNNSLPISWSELLSNKLNLPLQNYAEGSLSNDIILQRFCKNIDSINKGDIVIFEWSYPERFSCENGGGKLVGCSYGGFGNIIDKHTSEQISVNRTHDSYKEQILDYQKIIDKMSVYKDFEVWYWYADQNMYKFIDTNDKRYLIIDDIMKNNEPHYVRTTFDVVYELGGCDIETETKGEVKDNHFGESAHKIKADIFYDHIKKYSKLV
jgi:hypothetical protein